MTEEELDAGALLILACIAEWDLFQGYPRVNPPHSGMLPTEEVLSNQLNGIACDTTLNCSGRPWLILK